MPSHKVSPTQTSKLSASKIGEKPQQQQDGFDPRLCNADLMPLKEQTWNAYNIFAVWMTGQLPL
jgi:cytosine/uracil/thiamine/allantoin permease